MPRKKKENLIARPPVVVVLGHVDHGKSSILEAIKDLKITAKESGGITQHIGAYEIEHEGKKITFIDTPGHEAFSAMRSRGAKVADIAILVVSADDGVQEQTREAISHILKAEIPMIVALNKIDKPQADPEKVKRELVKQDILVESMGGKIPSVEVSAKTKKGINDLLEMILLIAEMENLKLEEKKPAKGVIIEAYMDSQRGPTATMILREGTIKSGDIVGTSSAFGKVKTLEDFQGKPVEQALPSMPVIVIGFENVPGVGEDAEVFDSAEAAENNIIKKEKNGKQEVIAVNPDQKIFNLILKADVAGSLEAIREVLKDIPQDKVILRFAKAEVGEINESDIKLAKSAKAAVVGFRVKVNPGAKSLALREKIKIRTFDIIYELAQAVRLALEKMITPEVSRVELGKVRISVIFLTEKNRQILGGKVMEGMIRKGASVEVYRNDENIGKGKIVGLQRNKKEIDEVAKGTECGMLYEGNVRIAEKDILVAFAEERRKIEL